MWIDVSEMGQLLFRQIKPKQIGDSLLLETTVLPTYLPTCCGTKTASQKNLRKWIIPSLFCCIVVPSLQLIANKYPGKIIDA